MTASYIFTCKSGHPTFSAVSRRNILHSQYVTQKLEGMAFCPPGVSPPPVNHKHLWIFPGRGAPGEPFADGTPMGLESFWDIMAPSQHWRAGRGGLPCAGDCFVDSVKKKREGKNLQKEFWKSYVFRVSLSMPIENDPEAHAALPHGQHGNEPWRNRRHRK